MEGFRGITRRQTLLAGVGALCLRSHAGTAVRAAQIKEVAPGIFIREGVDAEARTDNDDAIANLGFIVGQDSVAVFDPGGSLADGERLRTAILDRTRLPIRFVIFSHAHPDHIFGAGAFQRDTPQYIGHARLPAALHSTGDYYRERLEAVLGPGRAGPVVLPTHLVERQEDIDLGGRRLTLRAHGVAHSECDLSAVDSRTATLLAGDLLFVRRVPAFEGQMKGWLRELELLKSLPLQRAIPGHGPASVHWPAGAGDLERYLRLVQSDTRAVVKRGVEIDAAVGLVAQGERGRWTMFDEYHGHNVTRAFKEVEWE